MITVRSIHNINLDNIPIDSFWNIGEEKEQNMHHIHAYPAKFPAFITTKALDYAKSNNFIPKKIGDIFCGCGTTAYEARRNNIDFWGCDINPVATLIARVKSSSYQKGRLKKYYDSILNGIEKTDNYTTYSSANERLKYWYSQTQYDDLSRLKKTILTQLPHESKYQAFFLCAFSNILKPASKWLTKSIKPQVDPNKKPQKVLVLFKKQCEFMMKAYSENKTSNKAVIDIHTNNLLFENAKSRNIDMIITSPPYVTSYEYADLHQLSMLWLDYTDDYRKFRKGTIGSDYGYNELPIEQMIKSLTHISKIYHMGDGERNSHQ